MTAHDTPAVVLTPCPDGPILVRGDVEIRDTAGRVVPRRRATVALCRCGASGIKPFCDGSHKAVGFRTDDEVPRPDEPVAAPERSAP
jgi:CDGSH-type Zn-finger protein